MITMQKLTVRRRHKVKSQSLKNLFEEWYELVHSPGLAPSTLKRYEQELRLRLRQADIMSSNIDDIKAIHIH